MRAGSAAVGGIRCSPTSTMAGYKRYVCIPMCFARLSVNYEKFIFRSFRSSSIKTTQKEERGRSSHEEGRGTVGRRERLSEYFTCSAKGTTTLAYLMTATVSSGALPSN